MHPSFPSSELQVLLYFCQWVIIKEHNGIAILYKSLQGPQTELCGSLYQNQNLFLIQSILHKQGICCVNTCGMCTGVKATVRATVRGRKKKFSSKCKFSAAVNEHHSSGQMLLLYCSDGPKSSSRSKWLEEVMSDLKVSLIVVTVESQLKSWHKVDFIFANT